MGILVLLLGMAGAVFTMTLKSTGQALALMDTTDALKLLETTLRDDLAEVNPEQSMMVIQANEINAYWTAEGREADDDGDPRTGYPHARDPEREWAFDPANPPPAPWDDAHNGDLRPPRADVLMFFNNGDLGQQQVVYGHAEVGEIDPNTLALGPLDDFAASKLWEFDPTPPPDVYPVAANEWTLARRVVSLVDDPGAPSLALSNASLLEAINDRINRSQNPPNDEFVFDRDVLQASAAPGASAGGLFWWSRSRLDPMPPAQAALRLAHFMAAHCASFKVEWTPRVLDPETARALKTLKSVWWIDPMDVGNAATGSESGALGRLALHIIDVMDDEGIDRKEKKAIDKALSDLIEGVQLGFDGINSRLGEPGGIWYASDPDPNAGSDPDPFFPVALRITVDVFDPNGRLDRPQRRVMVIPVGS